MINLVNQSPAEQKSSPQPIPLLRLAFRPFFLLAGISAISAVWLWVLGVSGEVTFSAYGGLYWWHIHEMMFGFGIAVVAGFLLTAVQTWTGIPGVKGNQLALLISIWLAGRIAMVMPELLNGWVIVFVDLLFVPCLMVALMTPIISVSQKRNMIFAPMLLGFMLLNAVFHWMVIVSDFSLLPKVSVSVVLLMVIVISVIGGRVIPMFTANGTKTTKVTPLPWLEKATLLSNIILLMLSLFNNREDEMFSIALLVTGTFHLIRFLRWRTWLTLRVPMVWSLHVSYLCLAVGLILMGFSSLVPQLAFSQALHLVTMGAMSGMILAMMSRVSLGHTGRAILASKRTHIAFIALFLSAAIRVFGPEVISDYIVVLNLSAAMWTLAFGLFLWRYVSVLCYPRIDGKPG